MPHLEAERVATARVAECLDGDDAGGACRSHRCKRRTVNANNVVPS